MKCLKMFVLMWLLTGVFYPVVVTIIANTTMNNKAEGSFIVQSGSKLIAQKFTDNRYFWPRPSNNDYNAQASGGSNLGPISPALRKTVLDRLANYNSDSVPTELLYASGSGLDPHISPKTAYFQIDRVAKHRNISTDRLKAFVDQHIDHQFLGTRCINVLELNIALDEIK